MADSTDQTRIGEAGGHQFQMWSNPLAFDDDGRAYVSPPPRTPRPMKVRSSESLLFFPEESEEPEEPEVAPSARARQVKLTKPGKTSGALQDWNSPDTAVPAALRPSHPKRTRSPSQSPGKERRLRVNPYISGVLNHQPDSDEIYHQRVQQELQKLQNRPISTASRTVPFRKVVRRRHPDCFKPTASVSNCSSSEDSPGPRPVAALPLHNQTFSNRFAKEDKTNATQADVTMNPPAKVVEHAPESSQADNLVSFIRSRKEKLSQLLRESNGNMDKSSDAWAIAHHNAAQIKRSLDQRLRSLKDENLDDVMAMLQRWEQEIGHSVLMQKVVIYDFLMERLQPS